MQLGVLAEFRQDWLSAVSAYQAAAAALQGVSLGRPTVSCQRYAEVTAVAEVVHFKAMMLLLHQQRYAEAIQQLQGHLEAFGPSPEGLPLAAAATHYGWLARQYQCAAEMIAGSRIDEATLQAHKDVQPAHLLVSAAQLAAQRKAAAEELRQQRNGAAPPIDLCAVRKGRYLGQIEIRTPDGPAGAHSDMTDAEFALYLEAEELQVSHTQQVLDLLLQAQASHFQQATRLPALAAAAAAGPPTGADVSKGAHVAADRLQAWLVWLMAEQQVDSHNLTAARKLVLQAVYTYRRDGWDLLLLHCLLQLRDVCQRLKLHKEALLHSLEVACLTHSLTNSSKGGSSSSDGSQTASAGLVNAQQAAALASAAITGLCTGAGDKRSSIMKTSSSSSVVVDGPPAAQQAQGSSQWVYNVQQLDLAAALQQMPIKEDGAVTNTIAEVLSQHHQQDFGWWGILTVTGGFVAHSPDPQQLRVCIAVYNHLPVCLPVAAVAVTISDNQGSWTQAAVLGPGPGLLLQQQQPDSNRKQQLVAATAEVSSAANGPRGQHVQQQDTAAAAAADGISVWQLQERQQSSSSASTSAVASSQQLQPSAWQAYHVAFSPRQVGSVRVDELVLHISENCSVRFHVKSFPASRAALGHSSLPVSAEAFSVHAGVRMGVWAAKVQHVGSLPQLQVAMPDLLLVGEFVPINVVVQASAAQQAATLELSVKSAMGATPGHVAVLATMPDSKLQAVNPEGQALPVPALDAGTNYTQRLWVRSQLASTCRLIAVLSCPATVAQSIQLTFLEPFAHVTRLNGEMNMHTLVAPSHNYSTVIQADRVDGSAAAGGVPIVLGQSLFAQVLVKALHNVDLQLLDAEVELQQGSGLQLLNKLSDQLAGKPLLACGSSVHCLLLQLLPTATSQEPVRMGRLQLRWKRQSAAEPVSSGSTGAVAGIATLAAGAALPETMSATLELPLVVVRDSLLSVKVIAPHSVTAGIAFSFTLQMHNLTTQPQEVLVSVQDAQGFVFSGNKQQTLTLLAKDTTSCSWTMVAHVSGQLPLPAVRVSSAKLSCQLVTQQSYIQVVPF
eukprot:GHRR01002703.1.p1 GENE.GHRR01002703.1~~GHRR01002703.1.p1  ORF type:complete len:1063 (+),score=495.97 GHRR01002703.1:1057-4245(+)